MSATATMAASPVPTIEASLRAVRSWTLHVPQITSPSSGSGRGGNPTSASHLLDAGDHLVRRFFRRPAVVHHTAHSLGPYVLVVEDRELVILHELERHRAGVELVIHRLARGVG